MNEDHTYPLNDEREHITEGFDCWCDPRVEFLSEGTLVIHNSADMRELIEQAEEIKNNI